MQWDSKYLPFAVAAFAVGAAVIIGLLVTQAPGCLLGLGFLIPIGISTWKTATNQVPASKSEEYEDTSNNVILIVEAPDTEQLERANGHEHLEHAVYFRTLPKVGERLVLNMDSYDDANVRGVVEEVTRAPGDNFSDGIFYYIWMRLEKNTDYGILFDEDAWEVGDGTRRRTTSSILNLQKS